MRPPSVGTGTAVARSGTSCAAPESCARATSPSPVARQIAGCTSFGSAGSSTWMAEYSTRSVPPRCSRPTGAPAATQGVWPRRVTAAGAAPTVSRRRIVPVRGSTDTSAPVPSSVTQTPPAPAATAVGASPTGTVEATALRVGSTRESVPSSALTTHTAPPPTATGPAPAPTPISARISPLTGSIRTSLCASGSVTHSAPNPAATPPGESCSRTDLRGTPLPGSSATTASPPASATHTAPASAATATGRPPMPIV